MSIIKKLSWPRIKSALRFAVVLLPALIMRPFMPNIWLISERKAQARDNGFCFYKYLCAEHPDQKVYYIIDKCSADYKKIAPLGLAIQFDSWKHYLFFCLSRLHISAHVGGCCPTDAPVCRLLKPLLKYKDVFLPHGVCYGIAEFCLAKYTKIDLFITCGRPEYENVLANYGYTPEQVAYTGFPRLDGWHHITVNAHQIVLMPTWRLYLAQDPNTVFEETAYFKAYRDLINSPELAAFLSANDLKLIFYLHHNMRKYVSSFSTPCPNIEVVYRDDTYDIQELLKASALLITDYSSVHFDFAYMGKPVLYYQFDREEFWQKQYSQTDFDAAKDGFGPVAYDLAHLIANLKQAHQNSFQLTGEYEQRMKRFYELRDEHNCDRVYQEILKHFG